MTRKSLRTKRIFSIILSLAVALIMMPMSALAADGTSTVENAVAEVTINGTTTQYADIDAAFAAAQQADSATVKLLENVTISHDDYSGIALKKGNITLDLNGKTLSKSTRDDSGFFARNAVFWLSPPEVTTNDDFLAALKTPVRLTVQDNSADGNGKIVQPNGGPAVIATLNTILTVNGGTIENTSSVDHDNESNKHMTPNCAVLLSGGGKAVINGVTLRGMRGVTVAGYITKEEEGFYKEQLGIEGYNNDTYGNELTVTGGNICATSGEALIVYEKAKKIELSGGTFTTLSNTYSIWVADTEAEGEPTIKGDASSLLASGYRYEYNGTECAYSEDGKGVTGSATVALRPANEYAYIGADGKLTTRANCTEITAETWDISQGWYVVKENLTISSLNISGEVNLILCDGATLTVTSLMNVAAGSTLNLFWQSAGSGKLTAANITVPGTVTAPAGEMKKTTDEGGTTFEKCFEHDWEYTNNGDTHTAKCKLCGKTEAAESHKYDSWAPTDANTHTGTCACGATKTEDHTLTCTPNADGLTHSTKCSVCGYTAAAESHNFNQTDDYGKKCACGAYLAAEYNGQQYATLARAIEAAKNGGTVSLQMDVGERITVNDGMNVTIDLNNNGWTTDGNTAHATLVVTGGSVTVQNGGLTSGASSNAYTTVEVEGGKLTVGENMTIQGGMDADKQFPAIDVKGGELVLSVGAKLDGGMKVSVEGKQLKDYLPEGTAFTVNGTVINGYVQEYSSRETLVVAAHTHSVGENNKCACGFACPHNNFKDGKCTICGNGCAHTNVDENGLCPNCKTQMAVKITAKDGTVTYGTDFKAAMKAATDGTKITLLADVSIPNRTGISGDNTTVTLDLNEHKITGGWLDVGDKDTNGTYTTCTLKIIGKGSYEPPQYGGIITVNMKATLDLSKWEGGTISSINISDNSNYEAASREAAVIVGPKAGTIGKLSFGNNQLDKLKKTKLSGGSFNEIWAADFGPVKLGDLLADGYAYQNEDGSYVKYGRTLQGASIYNVKVVKCLHPNMKPDETGTATCEYCGKSGKFVASVDGNLYTDMDEAITYWLANGGTLKLYADYTAATEKATWTIVSGEHSIDLNGHTMSVQGDGAFFKPTNNMHLTVTDSKEIGQITNILLDGSQNGSFTLKSGYVGNLKMTGGAVVTLKGGSVDTLDVQKNTVSTNLSIQGGSIGELNIKDWVEGMHVSATSGSLGAYNLPSGKILADVLDHQYYAKGTSLDKGFDAAQKPGKFDIKLAPYDFGSTSKVANVPINGSIPFRVDSPSGDATGYYDVRWYRRTNSGAEHMTENRVAGVKVNDTLDVFCVITGADSPGGEMQWQVAVKDYTIKVVPADLSQGAVVFKQVGESMTGLNLMGNIRDGKGTFVFTPYGGDVNNASTLTYCFEVSHDGQKLIEGKDYTIESGNTAQYAGDHTLTIQGIGSYTGTATHTWRIEPYKLTRGNYRPPTITKVYDGTTGFDFSKAVNWGIFTENVAHRPNDEKTGKNPVLGSDGSAISIYLKPEDFKASAVTLDSPDAGDRTASYTITLKTRDGQREPNFVFEDGGSPTIQVTAPAYITKAFLSSSPKAGELNVANNHAATYTVDLSALLPKLTSPMQYGTVTYALGTNTLNSSYYDAGTAKIENGKLMIPIKAVKTDAQTAIGKVTVTVSSTNFHNFDLTVNVSSTNKIVPTGAPKLSAKTLTYGQTLSAIKLSGKLHDNVNNKDVEGTFTWVDGTVKPEVGSGTYEAAWKFTPTDGDTYAEADGTVTITINKATPTGTPKYTAITKEGQTLADANLTAEGENKESLFKALGKAIQGIVKWVESEDKTTELDSATKVEQGKAYTWLFTPTDTANYKTLSGTIVLWAKPSSGGFVTPAPVNPDVITVKEDTKDNTTSKPGAETDTTITTKTTVKNTTTETTKNEQGQDVSKTTASVSKDLGDKLLDQAVSNKSDTIEITVKSNETNNNGSGAGASAADSVKATEVELPKATVNAIAKDTNADLVIKTDNGEVVLDNKTLETIAGAAKGDTVTIVVGENTQLKETQKPAEKIVGKNGTLFDLAAKIGERLLHQFEGGKAHVTLPMPEKLKGKDVLVIYIDDNGLCKILNHSVEKIGAEDYIRFTTTHFSTFAVVDKEEAAALIKAQNEAHVKELMQNGKFKVTTTKTSKKSVKVTVTAKNNKTLISDIKTMGYTVKYQFYRSTKKTSGYKLLKTKTTSSFTNTKGKKGTKYYYKARVLVYDGKTLIAKSELKQASCGVRTWTK